jgi:hypothetical protein
MELQARHEIEEQKATDPNAAGSLNSEAYELMLAAGNKAEVMGMVRGLTGRGMSNEEFCKHVIMGPPEWGCGPEKSFHGKPRYRGYHVETLDDMAKHY